MGQCRGAADPSLKWRPLDFNISTNRIRDFKPFIASVRPPLSFYDSCNVSVRWTVNKLEA